MRLNCKHVSASEAGDYFQFLFEKERDDDKEYFLIQRQFEFPDGDKCYVKNQGEDYIGHNKIRKSAIVTKDFIKKYKNGKIQTLQFILTHQRKTIAK